MVRTWPPARPAASSTTTSWPRRTSSYAHERPPTPPPATTTRLVGDAPRPASCVCASTPPAASATPAAAPSLRTWRRVTVPRVGSSVLTGSPRGKGGDPGLHGLVVGALQAAQESRPVARRVGDRARVAEGQAAVHDATRLVARRTALGEHGTDRALEGGRARRLLRG